MPQERGADKPGVLRDVAESDLTVFFEHQREPEATRMALFPARERAAFDAHWRRVLADGEVTKKTVLDEGEVAGNIVVFERDGKRLVGYWIGREHWGKGLATRALAELLAQESARPLHAWVATTNLGSIRVLEKCGFVRRDSRSELDGALGEEIEEALFELA
ncbi:MAG: GNAT family N-acetyltransferase [Gaiellaceae bacterium]